MFGRMGRVIPDHVQTWINSQMLPCTNLETIAKVCISTCDKFNLNMSIFHLLFLRVKVVLLKILFLAYYDHVMNS